MLEYLGCTVLPTVSRDTDKEARDPTCPFLFPVDELVAEIYCVRFQSG
jgi:hypothetical protein